MPVLTKYYESPIGTIEIAATEQTITLILFAEAEKKPSPLNTASETSNAIIETCCTQLDEYFTGTRKDFDLPLAQEGTTFQQKIWTYLPSIPFGETLSYKDLAIATGDVLAIRAVANCNANNRICIVVPCHRIVGTDGSLTGYAGDLWRKKWLLQHELKHSGKQQPLTLFS